MKPARWKLVVNLLKQEQTVTGRLILAVAPPPLEVVLYECPMLVQTQPPQNPLRGFVQEAISLLRKPIAREIAAFLYLPQGVVELILVNLQQVGGAVSDTVGRWTVPEGAPHFRSNQGDPPIWKRIRQLICFWPKREILLPVLPRLRLRDLVELEVHRLQGDLINWYHDLLSRLSTQRMSGPMPNGLRLLSLKNHISLPSRAKDDMIGPDAPISPDEILVTKIRLDVVALVWANKRDGVWEVVSRLWSRPTPPDQSDGEPFAAGEPCVGVKLPASLIGDEDSLDDLGDLFSPDQKKWKHLCKESSRLQTIHRELDGDWHSILISEDAKEGKKDYWLGLPCSLGRDARLLCYTTSKMKMSIQMQPGE